MSDAPAPRRRLSIGVLAAVIGLATGTVGLVLTIRPDLAADPRTRIGATIATVAVDRRVSREEYIADALAPGDEKRQRKLREEAVKSLLEADRLSPEVLKQALAGGALRKQIGSVVYAKVQGQGLKKRDLQVYWWVYAAATRKRDYGGPGFQVTVKAPDDSFIVPTFVFDVACKTRRFLRLELRDENGILVAMETSKPYRICPLRGDG